MMIPAYTLLVMLTTVAILYITKYSSVQAACVSPRGHQRPSMRLWGCHSPVKGARGLLWIHWLDTYNDAAAGVVHINDGNRQSRC